MLIEKVVVVFLLFCFEQSFCENLICAINGKKSINTVDEKFLSLSIDPAALITGININYTSLLLQKHLSPSFMRIAGTSTEFLNYAKEADNIDKGLTITDSTWQSLNDWFKMANLTPVFAINDNHKINGAWNPKLFYPLLELSDKLNILCFWQLGFDSSCKTLYQYKEDLVTLKHIIDAFPSKKTVWKVVGGDISGYVYNISNTRQEIQSLIGQIDYFMYENASLQDGKDFPDMTMKTRLFPKSNFKIWTTAPKSQHPVTFASALEWARQIGDAARGGYNVVFRQPRLHEFFVDTPTYWVTLLHKQLMGRKVLDVKFSQEKTIQVDAFVHCTRKQNDFSKLGAITVMAINNETTPHVLALRIGAGNIKKLMIRSYVLTTTHENSVNTFLNGQKLSMELLEENEKFNFPPKLRRAHVTKFLSLPIPKKSIAFFVLPGARIPVCINEEYNLKLLMQEISEDQNVKLESEENDEHYEFPYFQQDESAREDESINFNEIFKQIEEELENDEEYYKNFYQYEITTKEPTTPIMKTFKRDTRQKRKLKPKKLLTLNFEIDNEEVKNFLKEKLRARASERYETFTSEEIEGEADRIAKRITNAIMRKAPKRYGKEPLRDTRDINMELVKTRAEHSRPHHHLFHHRDDDQHAFPKISSRTHVETHSPIRLHHRSQSRVHNRHSLRRPHHLKDKRDSDEGIQDAQNFMSGHTDASLDHDDFRIDPSRNDDLWEAVHPAATEIDDDLDYSFPIGHSMDYIDGDYYEIDMYPDDPFMRRKRRDAQQGNNVMQETYHYIFGKPVDPSKIHMSPRQKEHQLNLLRQRLARRKKLESVQKKIRPSTTDSSASAQETKVIVNGKRPFVRKKRSALELSLKARYKKHVPRMTKQYYETTQEKHKRSIDSSENEIEDYDSDTRNNANDVNLEHSKVPAEEILPTLKTSSQSIPNNSITSSTVKSVESETEVLETDCMTNDDCLSLILGSSLDPAEFLKPGWASKMYRKVVGFLAKLQKDVLQVMTN